MLQCHLLDEAQRHIHRIELPFFLNAISISKNTQNVCGHFEDFSQIFNPSNLQWWMSDKSERGKHTAVI